MTDDTCRAAEAIGAVEVIQTVEEVEVEAHRLMARAALAVPGDLGRLVRAIVGAGVEDTGSETFEATPRSSLTSVAQSTARKRGESAADAASVDGAGSPRDRDRNRRRGPAPSTAIEPPARPIRWASGLLALCCHAYGRPLERAVPVGACLQLFGITSSALDAAQDNHLDLLSAYGAAPVPPPASSSIRAGDPADGGALGHSTAQARTRRAASAAHTPGSGYSSPASAAGVAGAAALTSNASTAVIGLAWQVLLEHGPRYGVEAATLVGIGCLIAERLVEICTAQHLDLTVGRTLHLSLEEYDRVVEGKTGQIDGTACEVGALLAGASDHRALWHALGMERAVAQQLFDDYKDLADDLLGGGQVGHPVLYGLAVADLPRRELISTLVARARSAAPDAADALRELAALLRELGAEYYTLAAMVTRRNRALAALRSMQLPTEAHDWLHEWVMQAAPRIE